MTGPSPVIQGPSGLPPTFDDQSHRGIFVRVMVFLTVLISIFTVALIYYRWLTVPEPSAVLSLEGDADLDGAIIIVSDPSGGFQLTDEFDSQAGKTSLRFYLQPGTYEVQMKYQNRIIRLGALDMPRHRSSRVPVSELRAATQPTWRQR